ncbi:NUDIX hydrolase [Rhodococcus sp. ABRD24]|uniref:NUDIX hydrolase n=1 Tax=Rhodococcus sp. ABRD24 TaxID=2507582 RepID=UPI00103C1B9C|nr:NUDIX domain-containing protein [Rhodococcus sp. ABRD24]QBJ94787.1 NUDIX hydrolase [Rhodococcus sp. ABRD24]
MTHGSTVHEVLTAVFQVRTPGGTIAAGDGHHGDSCCRTDELMVLLWQRALDPEKGTWSLPGGTLGDHEDLKTSARRQLAEKVDVRDVAHLEQLSVFSDPHRVPGPRRIASTYLGLVPLPADPQLPPDTAWHPVSALPSMSFDHGTVVEHARTRLAAKLSYTNIAFALAPDEFTMSTLREIYCAALGYQVDTTNLQRVLTRRGVIIATGSTAPPGRTGGRPAALYRFTDTRLRVTDEFAALRPPV